ncbi:S-formylglutathione hydrolase [Candidatus Viadribacter manganicus]|uniref:S-formylglutathione hydrolase n=1 Tax=Candidatus Viadribacter manganicus TaxID=1759059 RepID=A0A1B1AJ06_9PROT|nr:S-formylglutathione hydrolase [Candidatus Viadribacter manganicus]ANP46548.1 S-formylglutathione hydrolase [Candidatus Viadribacter manganicus]
MQIAKTHRVSGGELAYASHQSAATGTEMRLSVFAPPGAGPFPYLIWLSGLTCTEDNFTSKAGAYAAAARLGVAIVAPDTSPRGEAVADDPAYDLGQGAGFYIDATQKPWASHFQMESYITRDLIAAVEAAFPLAPRRSMFGHSMGGHGALTLAMKHPQLFKSASAFSPIASPTRCPWGEKAFGAYLGSERESWRAHDAALLIEAGKAASFDDILIDQGTADQFLVDQLKPELLEEAARKAHQKLTLRRQEGYDHSYFFIATFVSEHVAFHAARLA